MFTADAIIGSIADHGDRVLLRFDYEGRYFPAYYEFDLCSMKGATDFADLMKFAGVKHAEDLLGKQVRVIDNEDVRNSLIAIGSVSKNKFIALTLDTYPTSEKRVYRKYARKLKRNTKNNGF